MSERQPDFGNPANIPSSVGSTAEKIPHSGKLPEEMREQPLPDVPENLEVFYETEYKGVNSGEIPLLKVKESLVQPAETAEKESNTKKRLIPAFLATGGAALSIVAGIYIGNQLSGDTEAPKEPTKVEAEKNEPQTIEEALEAYKESLKHGEELTESLLIPAGLSDDDLARAHMDNLTKWDMYGANPQLYQVFWQNTDGSEFMDAIYKSTSRGAGTAMANANFAPGWESNTTLINVTENFTLRNQVNLELYGKTFSTDEYDLAPFNTWFTIESVKPIPTDDGSRRLLIQTREYANTDMNRADDLGSTITSEGGPLTTIDATFINIDGNMKISQYSIN